MSASRYGKRLGLHEAMVHLDMSESAVRRLVAHGRIAYVRSNGKPTGRLQFWAADLDAFLEAERVPVMSGGSAAPTEDADRAIDRIVRELERQPVPSRS